MPRTKHSRREIVAYHEAGHAVYAFFRRVKIRKVTIVPDGGSLGSVSHSKILRGNHEVEWTPRMRQQVETLIQVCLAGPIAQRIRDPRSYRSSHAHVDHRTAVDAAMVLCSSGRQATAFLRYQRICVEEFLRGPRTWGMVEALAAELLRRSAMTGDEVRHFLLYGARGPGKV